MLLSSIWEHKSIWVLWFERKHPNGHPRPWRSSLDWKSFTSKKPLCSKSFTGWRQDEADWREINWWGERLQRRGDFPLVKITLFLVLSPCIPSPFLGLKYLIIFEFPGTAVMISCSFHILCCSLSGAWVWYEQMGWGWKNEHCKRLSCCSLCWTKGFFMPWIKLKPNNIVLYYDIRLKVKETVLGQAPGWFLALHLWRSARHDVCQIC